MSHLLALRAAWGLLGGAAAAGAAAQATTPNANSSITVAVKSSGRSGGAEAVNFSGNATITSRIDFDTDQRKPTVEYLLDLSGVVGVGEKSGTRFALTTQDIVVLEHRNNQQMEIVFALPDGVMVPLNKIRTGLAKFAVNVDLASGAISSASVSMTTRS